MRRIFHSWHHITTCCFFIAIFLTSLFCTPTTAHTTKQTESIKHTISNDPSADGFWKKDVQWKSRWVKYWRPKAIYVPIWKKVWSPVVQSEWVPLPKVPPGWEVKKDGVIDSSNSDWRSSSDSNEVSTSISSGSRDARSLKSPIELSRGRRISSGNRRSSYGSAYSTKHSGDIGWKTRAKRTFVSEVV